MRAPLRPKSSSISARLTPLHEGVRDLVDRVPGTTPDRAHPAHELLEEHPDLEPGQRGAETEVGAEPERDVLVGLAGHVEALGIVEVRRVAVGRRVHQHDLLTLADGRAAELVVAVGDAAHVERSA